MFQTELATKGIATGALVIFCAAEALMLWSHQPHVSGLQCAVSFALLLPGALTTLPTVLSCDSLPWNVRAGAVALFAVFAWPALFWLDEVVQWSNRSFGAMLDPSDTMANHWWGSDALLQGPEFGALAILAGLAVYTFEPLIRRSR